MTTAAHLHQLNTFIEGRQGWHIADPPETRECYAWRTIKVVDVAFHLFVRRDPRDPLSREGWKGSYRSDGGTLANHWTGILDAVTAEVLIVERLLEALNALRECQTRLAASEIVDRLKGTDLRFMCDVLDIHRTGAAGDLRRRLVNRTCGARLDSEAMNPKNGKW